MSSRDHRGTSLLAQRGRKMRNGMRFTPWGRALDFPKTQTHIPSFSTYVYLIKISTLKC